jgi:hypothetical protein
MKIGKREYFDFQLVPNRLPVCAPTTGKHRSSQTENILVAHDSDHAG